MSSMRPDDSAPLVCGSCGRGADRLARGWRGLLARKSDAAVEAIVLCPTCAERVTLSGEVERFEPARRCVRCGLAKMPWEVITIATSPSNPVCTSCLSSDESERLLEELEKL
jgi:hypothetical protein